MEKLGPKTDGATPDIVDQNIERLRELFPDAFTEGSDEHGSRWKVDFGALREILGSYVEDQAERYSFTWNGKDRARRIAQTPSTGTLRPCPEESINWDTAKNLFIEGDNLEVLKLLQKSYHKKVKMIYIDPPYNTGNDFIYPDDFRDNIRNYMGLTRQTDEEGRDLSTNSETSGRYHTNWLNMMYPRLKMGKNLLREDGVIMISIGDQEIANLRQICNDIFGEENLVITAVWEKKKKGAFLARDVTNVKDYVLIYCRSKAAFQGLIGQIVEDEETYPCINATNPREIRVIPAGIRSKYREKDYVLKKGETISVETMNLVLHSDLIIQNAMLAKEMVIEGNWRYRQELMSEFARRGELYLTQDLYLRRIVREPREKTLRDLLPRLGTSGKPATEPINPKDLFADGWGTNEDANEELRLLLGEQNILDYPKPSHLIAKLVCSIRDESAIVCDFFAGSGTTAHAVLNLNRYLGGNRRFIMVQLPEVCDKNSLAAKAGYKTIADIGKERIRRVIKKIGAEQDKEAKGTLTASAEEAHKLDLGFRVFKLDASNIKPWDVDFDNLEEALWDSVENIKPDRTEADVLYELLLKYGLDLTVPIEERKIGEKTIYIIGAGALIVCLAKNITLEVVEGIAALKEELKPEVMRVVFKDSGFADDVVKTNAVQILRQAGIDDVKSL